MKTYQALTDLKGLIGQPVGTSNWLVVDQQRINTFADATGDHQWIHVDVERAKQSPFGGPIAHGFLTLSLLPALMVEAFEIKGLKMGLNYGLNKMRFMKPVPAGSRVRGHFKLLSWEPLEGSGAQVTYEMTVEIEGVDKPACVAESIVRYFA